MFVFPLPPPSLVSMRTSFPLSPASCYSYLSKLLGVMYPHLSVRSRPPFPFASNQLTNNPFTDHGTLCIAFVLQTTQLDHRLSHVGRKAFSQTPTQIHGPRVASAFIKLPDPRAFPTRCFPISSPPLSSAHPTFSYVGRSPPLLPVHYPVTQGNQYNGSVAYGRLECSPGRRILVIPAPESPLPNPLRQTDEYEDNASNPFTVRRRGHTLLFPPCRSYSPRPPPKLVSRIPCQALRSFSIVHIALTSLCGRGIGLGGGEASCLVDVSHRIGGAFRLSSRGSRRIDVSRGREGE
ncbi:hypothetical protein FA13DRAFT_1474055 [Coprinellus micaceus]|uniref:Uncharacterized protein n=1 Tax=Coprinellus micaceus TaxID=71717 RepID=A0A4Y7SLD4_COPMI|nr:hypothetical protein FA13DRAFT_1474055 [Coprinellus micaceus]